jgi:mannose-6-phosphate isomerase-like protein (cupin superfamily)
MELTNINEDSRGFIKTLVGDLSFVPEITIFKTKAGMARGGCIHPNSQEHLVVVEGTINYIYRMIDSTLQYKVLTVGESITIVPNVPHYFISITDSIVLEWGPKIEEKQDKYEEFRKIVLGINSIGKNP